MQLLANLAVICLIIIIASGAVKKIKRKWVFIKMKISKRHFIVKGERGGRKIVFSREEAERVARNFPDSYGKVTIKQGSLTNLLKEADKALKNR